MAITNMARHVEELTGLRPVTCPWRVFYDPFVSHVVRLATLAQEGIAPVELGDDPPAIWLDALYVYLKARAAVIAHDHEQDRKKDKSG